MAEPDFKSDPWLDARLRNVPLPVNLLARLQEIGTAETHEMDRALRNVPVPAGLIDRLRGISRLPQRRFVWSAWPPISRELALAAAVLLAVGLGSLTVVRWPPSGARPMTPRQGKTAAAPLAARWPPAVAAPWTTPTTMPPMPVCPATTA
jgi:hypothetical protein